MKDVNEQEQQLIEMLREWAGDDEYCLADRIEIERNNGAWEIALSMPSKKKAAHGVGKTFAEAWDNVDPSRA